MTKIKTFSQQKPVLFSVGICLLFLICLRVFGELFALFPYTPLVAFLDEGFDILWPIALTFLCGYGFIYSWKGFGATLKAGAVPLAIYVFLTFFSYMVAADNPQTQWMSWPGILVGVLGLLGIGIREEVIFRGIIGNVLAAKYGTSKKGLWFAVIVSSVLFGGIHISNFFLGAELSGVLTQIVGATTGGFLFMAVYLRGGNIWVVALIHGLNDAVGLFASSFTMMAVTDADIIGNTDFVRALIPMCIEVGLTLFLLRKSKLPSVFARVEQLRAAQGFTAEQE